MIPGGLINAWFKTERAKKHLDELNEALQCYVASDKKPFSISVDGDGLEETCTVRVEIEEPHVWVFLIAGDVFNCLRAALDHAVWRIASLHVAKPKDNIQFPIISLNDDKGQQRLKDQTDGLPDDAVAVIKTFQPYNRPAGSSINRHLLWCLGKLTNIDKHRRIAVHPTVALMHPDIQPTSATGDDRKTFVFSVPKPLPSHEIRVEIIFGSEADGVALTLWDIHALYEFVATNVLVHLARFDP